MTGQIYPARRPAQITFPLSLTALLLLIPVAVSPLMRMDVGGYSRTFHILKGLSDVHAQGLPPITAILGWCFLGTAFLKNLSLLMLSTLPQAGEHLKTRLAAAARFAGIWESYEVLLIGVVVCMLSLSGMGQSQLSVGFLYLFFLGITSALASWHGRALTDPFNKPVGRQKPVSNTAVTEALVVTGFLLYIPAMLFPVASVSFHGATETRTLIAGVTELIKEDKWLLGAILFAASIAIPFLKLAGLGTLALAVRTGWRGTSGSLLRVFRLIQITGKWAMLDLFVLVILVSVVDFGFIATVQLESTGVYFFCALLITTLQAAETLDFRSLGQGERATRE